MPPNMDTGSRLLRNLRDLQLDDELDWPGIKPDTFAAKDSVHNQAARIKNAEWVVFNLLQIWDPAATKEAAKLFPAYEPRSSLELRAALFVQLSQLKKDGIFPKDLILRKTMFDDCKGPKFEELLLSLSVSVLMKVLDEHAQDRSVTKNILLTDSNAELSHLQILDTAYRGSLSHLLVERANLRRRWQRFGRVLKLKEDEIAQRRVAHERKVEQSKQSRIPRRRLDRLQAHIERDWSASNEWKGIILRGDQHLPQATLLERPYDDVWQHASDEKLYKIQPAGNLSALQKLEQQIEQQTGRLDKWRKVKVELDRVAARSMPPPATRPTSERPKTAQRVEPKSVQRVDPKDAQRAENVDRERTLSPELGTTTYELNLSSPTEANYVPSITERMPKRGHNKSDKVDSPSLSILTNGLEGLSVLDQSTPEKLQKSRTRPTSMLIEPASAVNIPSPQHVVQRKRSQTVVYSPQVSARPSLDRQHSLGSSNLGIDTDDEALDFQEDEATSIINSVLNADPSPSKPSAAARPPPLSLTERARMSMAQPTNSMDSPTRKPGSSGRQDRSPSPKKQLSQDLAAETWALPNQTSLDERTRQTMASMAASATGGQDPFYQPPPLMSHHSYSNSYSSRPSTARRTTVTKRTSRSPEKRAARPQTPPDLSFVDESLLAENVDEDTIFMSRPRIAHSPPRGSPVRDDDAESVEDFS